MGDREEHPPRDRDVIKTGVEPSLPKPRGADCRGREGFPFALLANLSERVPPFLASPNSFALLVPVSSRARHPSFLPSFLSFHSANDALILIARFRNASNGLITTVSHVIRPENILRFDSINRHFRFLTF